jgi:hypothetical protein
MAKRLTEKRDLNRRAVAAVSDAIEICESPKARKEELRAEVERSIGLHRGITPTKKQEQEEFTPGL